MKAFLLCAHVVVKPLIKFGNLTLSFGRLRQRIELKCVPRVQHDYFSAFNHSDHCFLASSLLLPSSLLHVVVWPTTSNHCSKKRAPRAARLFFLIQPIKSFTDLLSCRSRCRRRYLNSLICHPINYFTTPSVVSSVKFNVTFA